MRRWSVLWVFVGLLSIPGLSAGEKTPSKMAPTFRALAVFSEVYGHIKREYVDTVDPSTLVYSAIAGMARALDPHSEFLTPTELARFRRSTRGGLVGVGIEIAVRDEDLVVVSVLPGAPAAEAGIVAGESIRRIDGRRSRGMTLGRAVRTLQGEAGTLVELQLVGHDGRARPEVLKRRFVEVESVAGGLIQKGVAHLRVRGFQRDTAKRLSALLGRLQEKAGGELAGVILDLRDNAGGLVAQAVDVADLFLVDGEIVTMRGRTPASSKTWTAGALGTYADVPLVVVTNAGTASAAEIVVGALQSNRRAVVVGTRTFGKGSVQRVIKLSDGSGLKLTVAHYFTPAGDSIQGRGIEPDLVVSNSVGGHKKTPFGTLVESKVDERTDNQHGDAMPTRAPLSDPVLNRALEVVRVSDILRRRP